MNNREYLFTAAPSLGLYGGADQGIPLDAVERLRAALPPSSLGSWVHPNRAKRDKRVE
jgi:hypothetical protein